MRPEFGSGSGHPEAEGCPEWRGIFNQQPVVGGNEHDPPDVEQGPGDDAGVTLLRLHAGNQAGEGRFVF